MKTQQNISLKNYNTFGIDVTAKRFIAVDSVYQLQQLLKTEKNIFLISGGSNMLLTKDIEKLVVLIDIKGISIDRENHNDIYLTVNAGENWHEFVLWCVENNYGGIENLSLIPGNVGTCPIQNIGAYGVELKDTCISVEAIEIATSTKIEKRNEFSATVTHDIDEVLSGWKHRIRTQLERKQYLKAISFGFSHLIKPFHPWKNLVELSEFNTKNGVNSTFFILTRNNKLGEIKNADYPLSDSYVQNSLKKINESNHELGIHGSYKTHDSLAELKSDISNLKFTVTGNRFHFLQFDINNTPKVLNQAGIKYDTTLGFQESIGFRNSICTPFYLYDFEGRTGSDLARYYFGSDTSSEQWIGNTILQYDVSFDRIDSSTLVGLEYRDASTQDASVYGLADNINIDNPVYTGKPTIGAPYSKNDQDETTKSVFLQQNLSLDDRYILTFGIRHKCIHY